VYSDDGPVKVARWSDALMDGPWIYLDSLVVFATIKGPRGHVVALAWVRTVRRREPDCPC
jgi:hypothetical protein